MSRKKKEQLIFRDWPVTYVSCRISPNGLLYTLFFSGPQSKVIAIEITEAELPQGFHSTDNTMKLQAIQEILNNKQ